MFYYVLGGVLEEVPANWSTKKNLEGREEEKEVVVVVGGWSSSETMETKLGHCTNFVLFFF